MKRRDWFTSDDPQEMAGHIISRGTSDRKLRLFACACMRLAETWQELDDHSRAAVEAAEAYADERGQLENTEDIVSCRDMEFGIRQLTQWYSKSPIVRKQRQLADIQVALLRDLFGIDPYQPYTSLQVGDIVQPAQGGHMRCGSGGYEIVVVVSLDPFALVSIGGDMLWTATVGPWLVRRHDSTFGSAGAEYLTTAAFRRWRGEDERSKGLHCRPFLPEWRTPTAVAVATSIYEGRDWAALPILADALEDAGAPGVVTSHLRAPCPYCRDAEFTVGDSGGPLNLELASWFNRRCACDGTRQDRHTRGCWVLDLVMGKE